MTYENLNDMALSAFVAAQSRQIEYIVDAAKKPILQHIAQKEVLENADAHQMSRDQGESLWQIWREEHKERIANQALREEVEDHDPPQLSRISRFAEIDRYSVNPAGLKPSVFDVFRRKHRGRAVS